MEQYIKKSALVTEIDRLKVDALQKKEQCKRKGLEKIMHQINAYNKVLSFINTIEVKEVDLEEEIDIYYNYIYYSSLPSRRDDIESIAKYFFSLGLKAQKGE